LASAFWSSIGDKILAQYEFYRERAAEARAGALTATLHNVRDRWLKSEATWTEMADRSERSEKFAAEKAGERAALKAAAQG
jgi:hypothetical protein